MTSCSFVSNDAILGNITETFEDTGKCCEDNHTLQVDE